MSDLNPYQNPSADLASQNNVLGELMEPQHCPASSGSDWISQGFTLFKAYAGMWIAIIIVNLVIAIVINLVPGLNYLGAIIGPIWSAGLLFAARESDVGSGPEIGHLFVGFKKNLGSLIAVGALTFAGYIAIFIISAGAGLLLTGALGSFSLDMFKTGHFNPAILPAIFVALIVGATLALPLIMSVFFAPALVIFHDVGPIDAMKLSFAGCLKNVGSLTIWSVLMILLMILGAIPLMLGLLVVIPVVQLSMYLAYKAIFLSDAEGY